MKGLGIVVVALAALTVGGLFADAEEGSQCSARLLDGTVCRAACDAGQAAFCKADGSRVGCYCKDAEDHDDEGDAADNGVDHDDEDDGEDNGEDHDRHQDHDGNDSRRDGGGDTEP